MYQRLTAEARRSNEPAIHINLWALIDILRRKNGVYGMRFFLPLSKA